MVRLGTMSRIDIIFQHIALNLSFYDQLNDFILFKQHFCLKCVMTKLFFGMVLWIPYQNSDALCLCILLAFSKHLRRRLVYDFKITNSFLSAQFDFTLKSTRKHFSRSYHLENIYPNRPLPISSFQTHNTQPRQYYLSTYIIQTPLVSLPHKFFTPKSTDEKK